MEQHEGIGELSTIRDFGIFHTWKKVRFGTILWRTRNKHLVIAISCWVVNITVKHHGKEDLSEGLFCFRNRNNSYFDTVQKKRNNSFFLPKAVRWHAIHSKELHAISRPIIIYCLSRLKWLFVAKQPICDAQAPYIARSLCELVRQSLLYGLWFCIRALYWHVCH